MDWISTANGLVALITAFVSLCGAGISLFFMVKKYIEAAKDKTAQQNWNTIMSLTKAAMTKAEETTAKGADKKTMVIESVKAGAKELGINADDFMDQLDAFIDSMISFANTIK